MVEFDQIKSVKFSGKKLSAFDADVLSWFEEFFSNIYFHYQSNQAFLLFTIFLQHVYY